MDNSNDEEKLVNESLESFLPRTPDTKKKWNLIEKNCISAILTL